MVWCFWLIWNPDMNQRLCCKFLFQDNKPIRWNCTFQSDILLAPFHTVLSVVLDRQAPKTRAHFHLVPFFYLFCEQQRKLFFDQGYLVWVENSLNSKVRIPVKFENWPRRSWNFTSPSFSTSSRNWKCLVESR